MDDKLLLYNNSEPTLDAASKRKIAVDVALELTRLDTPADLRAIPWIAIWGIFPITPI